MTARSAVARSASAFGVTSTAAIGLLPKLTCPLCWPAYSAALGALGLGFVDYTPYLLPLTAAFVCVAVAALAWRGHARHSHLPVAVGGAAGALLLLGKFALDSDTLTYGAAGLFLIASFLPIRRGSRTTCGACSCDQAKEAG